MTHHAATPDHDAETQLEESWSPAGPSVRSTSSELDQVWNLDRLSNAARRSKKESDQDKLWRATFGLDRWWCVPIDSGDGHWAPAAGEIRGVNTLFAFSTEQRARRFAIEQNILAAEGEFQGAPTRPVDIVRNASTYIASGVEAIMIDGHRTGHFLPMQNLGRYWEQLCGPLPE
jgi:hypothetical protein